MKPPFYLHAVSIRFGTEKLAMAHLSITLDQEQINRHPLESTKVGVACKFSRALFTMKPPERNPASAAVLLSENG